MRLSIATVKTLFWISIVLFISTMLISIWQVTNNNQIIEWVKTILIGVFCSSIVVMICEYIRYLHLKRDFKDAYFYNLSLIYLKMNFIVADIQRVTLNSQLAIDTSFLSPQMAEMRACLQTLSQLEYCQIQKNEFSKSVKDFLRNKIPQLNSFAINFNMLNISIREDLQEIYENKLSLMKNHCDTSGISEVVTSESPRTKQTLIIINEAIENTFLNMIDNELSKMERIDDKKYKWSTMKEKITGNTL